MLALTLPYPPSVNHYWRHVVVRGRAQVHLSTKGARYRRDVAMIIFAQTQGAVHFDGWVAVEAIAYPPDKRERDLDNLPKSVFDALQATKILERDSQIVDFRFRRGPVVKGGELKMRIVGTPLATTEDFDHASDIVTRRIIESLEPSP